MLSELKIENVAVIEKAQVHFDQGFNVLTGETGAGKSILIDSIQAIMGSRVSRDLVRTGARKACIWATFEPVSYTHLDTCGVCLVKPQFEAGREKVGKKGVVREISTHIEVMETAAGYAEMCIRDSHESGLCSDGRRCGSDHRQSAGGLWQPHPFHVRQGTGKCEEHGSEYDRYYRDVDKRQPFKNPRNAAAGSLRQKDSKITAGRGLSIFVFNVQQVRGKTLTSHHESLDYLKSLGFPVSPRYRRFSNIEDAIGEIQRIGEARGKLAYDIDGAVIKTDRFDQREMVGSTNKFPRWAIAFKYPPEEKETVLKDIRITVGRCV